MERHLSNDFKGTFHPKLKFHTFSTQHHADEGSGGHLQ